MADLISAGIMAVLTFVVGYVEVKRNKAQILADKSTEEFRTRQEERAAVRQQEAQLSMKMMFTTLKLADVTAFAVSGGKCNGNVTKARDEAAVAMNDYNEFIMNCASKQSTKI